MAGDVGEGQAHLRAGREGAGGMVCEWCGREEWCVWEKGKRGDCTGGCTTTTLIIRCAHTVASVAAANLSDVTTATL